MSVDISSAVTGATVSVVAAGALVVGVLVAVKAVHWLRCVIIERRESADYYDRYGQ